MRRKDSPSQHILNVKFFTRLTTICYDMYEKGVSLYREDLMKHINYYAILLSSACIAQQCPEPFSLILESKWEDLEHNPEKTKLFGSQWILAGIITFKKKPNESVSLCQLHLSWHGNHIEKMSGSIYKKEPDKPFMPIEENLICDGTWSSSKQAFMFNFDKSHKLGPTNNYYLVLTVPLAMKSSLQGGYFSLESECLPEQYQSCAQNCSLNLSIDTLDLHITAAH